MSFVLYRHFDANDVLLYVGQSRRFGDRMGAHQRNAPWWDDVITITMERFGTAHELTIAEIAAIQREDPKYNTLHARKAAPQLFDGIPDEVMADWFSRVWMVFDEFPEVRHELELWDQVGIGPDQVGQPWAFDWPGWSKYGLDLPWIGVRQ